MTDVAAALDRLAALARTLGVSDDDLAAIIRETIAEDPDGDATFDDRLIEARARLMQAAVRGSSSKKSRAPSSQVP